MKEKLKMAEEAILYPDTFQNKPIGAHAANVIRELKKERGHDANDRGPEQCSPEELEKIFYPPLKEYRGKVGPLSAKTQSTIDAIRSAGSMQEALKLTASIPELLAVSSGRSVLVFRLRLDRRDPNGIMGSTKTYATNLDLVATSRLIGRELCLRVVHQDASRMPSEKPHREPNQTVSIRKIMGTGLLALGSKKASSQLVEQELRGTLTPSSLADAIEGLLTTGKITRVAMPYSDL
ncbi:hypothetical protein ACFL6C_03195 [Myxococcota bacterium]